MTAHSDTCLPSAHVVGTRAQAHVVVVPGGFQVEVWRPTASGPFRLLRCTELEAACRRAVAEALPWRAA